MKEILCNECNKSYKINYYYTHKNHSKKHLMNVKKQSTNLLNVEQNNDNRNVKLFLEDIKNKIDEYLNNI